MAATIKVPSQPPAGPQHRQFLALIAVGVALVLAVTVALIVNAVARGLAPAPAGHPGQARGAYSIESNGQSRSSHARTAW